jgi:hypothetical protein
LGCISKYDNLKNFFLKDLATLEQNFHINPLHEYIYTYVGCEVTKNHLKKKRKKASLPQAKGQEPFWSEATCSINEGWEETNFYNISYHKLFYTMHCSYLQKNPKKEKK